MRAFVAIDIAPDIRHQLAKLQRELEPRTNLLRWTDPEKIHLTLQFLGQMKEDMIPDVSRELALAVKSSAPFDLTIAGIGTFPSPRALRVLWVGVREDSGQLANLQKSCEARLAQLGFEPEARDFNPHLTLARAKGEGKVRGLEELIESHVGFDAGKMRVSEIVLYESNLSPHGANYTARARLSLAQ